MGEVRRHCAPMGQALALLRDRLPSLRVVLPTVPGVADAVAALTADWPVRLLVLDPREMPQSQADARKWAAFCAADAALAASGTVALELAAAGTPMVSIYRANALTAAIVRRLVRIDTGNLVNLVAGEKVVPEFFQERLQPGLVADAVAAALSAGPARDRQQAAMARVIAALGGGGEPPGLRAARSVLECIGKGG
jgi:lipid-A-disaccharide synthase